MTETCGTVILAYLALDPLWTPLSLNLDLSGDTHSMTSWLFVMGAVHVTHNCVQARVTKANITATNGVVYMVDSLFGFIYNDLYTEIKRDLFTLEYVFFTYLFPAHRYISKLEGAHESAYLRQALAFNAEKFRGSRDSGHAPFWKNFLGSCPDSAWEHFCQISSP